ncbi:MAG: hypothetical protein L6Q51_08720 [Cyclobacteriaceae bacterium]|nr:hypothetical protein [Cyclobacteriaceae bacterium]
MKKPLKILLMVSLVVLAVALFGWATMSLWNWLIPDLFGGPAITYWQALGLLVLSKILFSGLGKGGGNRHHGWKRDWSSKLSQMTPEERARFKMKFNERWCKGAQPKPADGDESQQRLP